MAHLFVIRQATLRLQCYSFSPNLISLLAQQFLVDLTHNRHRYEPAIAGRVAEELGVVPSMPNDVGAPHVLDIFHPPIGVSAVIVAPGDKGFDRIVVSIPAE